MKSLSMSLLIPGLVCCLATLARLLFFRWFDFAGRVQSSHSIDTIDDYIEAWSTLRCWHQWWRTCAKPLGFTPATGAMGAELSKNPLEAFIEPAMFAFIGTRCVAIHVNFSCLTCE